MAPVVWFVCGLVIQKMAEVVPFVVRENCGNTLYSVMLPWTEPGHLKMRWLGNVGQNDVILESDVESGRLRRK